MKTETQSEKEFHRDDEQYDKMIAGLWKLTF